jgi:hypothetical protein
MQRFVGIAVVMWRNKKPNNAMNFDGKKRRFALFFASGYGWH